MAATPQVYARVAAAPPPAWPPSTDSSTLTLVAGNGSGSSVGEPAVLRWGGQSYANGVVGRDVMNSDEAWVLSPAGGWGQLAYDGSTTPAPARNRHCALLYGDQLLILLGRHTETNQQRWYDMSPDVYSLDLVTRAWALVPATTPPPPPRSGAACALRGDSVIVVGGVTVDGLLLGDTWAFHVPSGTWAPLTGGGDNATVTGAPPPSYGAGVAYAPGADVLLVHGGRTAGVQSMTANANVVSQTTALVFDGTPDSAPPGGGGGAPQFAGIRGAWTPVPVAGVSVARAFEAAAFLPRSQRFCAFGGVAAVSFGDSITSDLQCLEVGAWLDAVTRGSEPPRIGAPPAAGRGGAVGAPNGTLPAAPAVRWRQLSLPAAQPTPGPRAFHAAALAPLGAGYPFNGSSDDGDPLMVLTGGRDYASSLGDVWTVAVPPAAAVGLWIDPPANGGPESFWMLSYLAYGLALLLLTALCMLLLLRHSRLGFLGSRGRRGAAAAAANVLLLEAALAALAANAASRGGQAASDRPRGLDAGAIAALPVVRFAKAASTGAVAAAVAPSPQSGGRGDVESGGGGGGAYDAAGAAHGRAASSTAPYQPFLSDAAASRSGGSGGAEVAPSAGSGAAYSTAPAGVGAADLEAARVASLAASRRPAAASGGLLTRQVAPAGGAGRGAAAAGKAAPPLAQQHAFDPATQDECAICLSNFEDGDQLTLLPCRHGFHTGCIRPWLLCSTLCPLCKHDLQA